MKIRDKKYLMPSLLGTMTTDSWFRGRYSNQPVLDNAIKDNITAKDELRRSIDKYSNINYKDIALESKSVIVNESFTKLEQSSLKIQNLQQSLSNPNFTDS